MSLSTKILSKVCLIKKNLIKPNNCQRKISLLSNVEKLKKILSRKETPLCTHKVKASYTVEASVVLPLFICAVIAFIFFFQVLLTESKIQSSLEYATRTMACYQCNQKQLLETAEVIALAEKKMIEKKTNIDHISGGLLGISYAESDLGNNYVHLVAKYKIELPFGMLKNLSIPICQSSCSRKWIGWDPQEGRGGDGYAYITENGVAYHTNLHCSYLNPSIRAVEQSDVSSLRNISKEKYKRCPLCVKKDGAAETVFVTDYGNCYHTSLCCSGLKRTIYRRKISALRGYHACSKCGKGGD